MLLKNKFNIIRIIVAVLFIAFMFVCFWPTNPYKKIEEKIGLSLPSSSKVLQFNYGKKDDDLHAKVQVDDKDLDQIRKELFAFFKQRDKKRDTTYLEIIAADNPWWDLNYNNIEESYHTRKYVKKHLFESYCKCMSMAEAWVVIVKQGDGKHFLYITY